MCHCRDKASIVNHVRRMPYLDQTTNTAAALQYMRTVMFTRGNGDRSGAPNAVIIITDGVPRVPDDVNEAVRRTVNEANLARQQGINVFAVAIGKPRALTLSFSLSIFVGVCSSVCRLIEDSGSDHFWTEYFGHICPAESERSQKTLL